MANYRKIENAALALAIFGAILIVPPLLNLFNIEILLFGTPLIIIYLFTLWILLIVGTFLLSIALAKHPSSRVNEENDIMDIDEEGES